MILQPLDVVKLRLSGTIVIEASAGTGKTYTITSLFLRLLIEDDLPVDAILVVTYTRAATAELRERIRARLALALRCARGHAVDDGFVTELVQRAREHGAARLLQKLETALANIEQAAVLTIHAFCQRVLRDHAFESRTGFTLSVTAHAAPLIDEIASDYYTAELFDTPRLRAQELYDELAMLRALAGRAGGAESVRIVPAPGPRALPSLDAWLEARDECRKCWEQDRAGVLALVKSWAGGQARHLPSWAEGVDRLLAGEEPGVSQDGHRLHKGFRYFTQSFAMSKAKRPASHPLLQAAQHLWDEDARLCAALAAEKVAFRAGFARYLRDELERRTRQRDVCTFDALLSELSGALSGPHAEVLLAALRTKYRAALVDEFQDTDPAQYRMFRHIFADAGRPLLLIGDPKQAIYAFRGADVQAYLTAREDAGAHVYTLATNRRSDPALIEALNAVYAQVERPFLREEIQYHEVSTPAGMARRFFPSDEHGPVDLSLLEAAGGEEAVRREIARRVAADIARLLGSGARRADEQANGRVRELRASDIAVLCRTNREAHEVQLALSSAAVPSVLSGDTSVFDSDDAEHLERVLSVLAHPAEPRALRAFLCSIYAGLTAHDLLQLEHDDSGWDTHARRVRELHELFVTRGFTQAMRSLCTRYHVEERLLARPDGLRRLTNLNHLVEILAQVSLSDRLGPLGLLRWLMTARHDADLRADLVAESHELRLESNDNAVQLTTVHKSKGLEYPIVYCPYLYKAAGLRPDEKQLVRFHDPHDGVLSLDVGGPAREEHAKLAEAEALAEALRLLYVALTRAKHRVVVVLATHKPAAKSPLLYTLLGGGDPERVGARLEHAGGGAGLPALLTAAGAEAGRGYTLRHLPSTSAGSRLQPPTLEPLGVRSVRRRLDNKVRTASFSALIAERTPQEAVPTDYDALAPEEAASEAPASTLLLDAFPRGAGPGKLIHEVLEHCSFGASDEARHQGVLQVLRRRGANLELAAQLSRGLGEMLAAPLDASGLSLASIPDPARVNELEFLFPVSAALTPRLLARCFRSHGAPSKDPSYARRLEALSFEELRGQLRGFIDLVFEHEGRFYLVDYKSNRLGPLASDYAEPSLIRAMSEHHYFLQYHLYVLALHRYLGQRLADYDYTRHFGGAYYLFLRGMAPRHPLRNGVFFDRPERALIEALDQGMRERAGRAEAEAP